MPGAGLGGRRRQLRLPAGCRSATRARPARRRASAPQRAKRRLPGPAGLFPQPPEPVSITSRPARTSARTSASSAPRPTKLVSCTGRLPARWPAPSRGEVWVLVLIPLGFPRWPARPDTHQSDSSNPARGACPAGWRRHRARRDYDTARADTRQPHDVRPPRPAHARVRAEAVDSPTGTCHSDREEAIP